MLFQILVMFFATCTEYYKHCSLLEKTCFQEYSGIHILRKLKNILNPIVALRFLKYIIVLVKGSQI